MITIASILIFNDIVFRSHEDFAVNFQIDRSTKTSVVQTKENSRSLPINDSQLYDINSLLAQNIEDNQIPEDKTRDLIPQQILKPLPRELPNAKPNPLQPNNPSPLPNPNSLPPDAGEIVVSEFEFLDNTAFSSEQLAEATKHLKGKPVSFTELLEVEQAITRLYTDAGYVNSGAYLPSEQTLSVDGAVVKVQVVEGSLESVIVNGTKRLGEDYIRDRLPATREKPLNQEKLLRDLQLLQLNPLIASISAQLSEGARRETSYLTIDITEADTNGITSFIDNGRSPSVGSFRRGIKFQENNFLGFGDRINLVYANTDGSNSGDISYEFPINHRNGSFNIAVGINDTKVVESPFEDLNIVGDSFKLDFGLRQPIVYKPNKEFALGVTFSFQNSETKLPGNNDTNNRVSAIRFSQELTDRNPTELFAIFSQFSLGLDFLNSTTNDNAADSRFLSWRGQTQYVKLLAPETFVILRGDLQFSSDSLLAQEQYSLGGVNTVRGYRQNFLLADGGALASAEIQLPLWRFEGELGALHLIPFFDVGKVWNTKTSQPDPHILASLGMGLGLNVGNVLDARIDWGIPLADVDDGDDSLQENGIHFSLDYRI